MNIRKVLDKLLAPEVCELGDMITIGVYNLAYTGVDYLPKNVGTCTTLGIEVRLIVYHGRGTDGFLFLYDRKNLLCYSNGMLVEYSGRYNSFHSGYVWFDTNMIPHFKHNNIEVRPVSCKLSDLIDLSIFNWVHRGATYMIIPVKKANVYNSFEFVVSKKKSNGISYTEPSRCIDVAIAGNDGFFKVFSYAEYQLMMKCGLTSILQIMECHSYGLSTDGTLTVRGIRHEFTFISNNLAIIKDRFKSTYWFRGTLFSYKTEKDRTPYLSFTNKSGVLVPEMMFIEEEHELVVREGVDLNYVLRNLV